MKVPAHRIDLDREALTRVLTRKLTELLRQPEHASHDGFRSYMAEADGTPVVRLSVANCEPGMDIWQGLRSPAKVGLYPVGLEDIWRHYAAANVSSTRYDGSPNPLAMPEPFEGALKRYKRAVILSAMLAIDPGVFESYAEKIDQGDLDPVDDYCRARTETAKLIDKALGRLSLGLMAEDRIVVPMTGDNVAKVIDGSRGAYSKGKYHGPCNSHYPQNSVAVLTGLLRFGVSRLPFRDEIGPDGKVRRLMGRYASIVIFDQQEPVKDGRGGMQLLNGERLKVMVRLNDYTHADEQSIADRYCTYNLTSQGGQSVCGKCIVDCLSGALGNSSPSPAGQYAPRLLEQKHRFSDEWLDFDFGNCGRERGQKAQIYPEYECGRCEAICAARGIRKSPAEIRRINEA